jgi:broad specificity phosphatase PhoE
MTEDKAALSALLERVEAATGPDRGLDVFIAQAVEKPTDMLNGMMFDEAIERFPHDLAGIANHWPIAPYTSSLDAALALVARVLPGWLVSINDLPPLNPAGAAVAALRADGKADDVLGYGNSRALAILAALLKALGEPAHPTSEGRT